MNLPLFPEGAAQPGSTSRTRDQRVHGTGREARLTPPTHHAAPRGTSEVAAQQIAAFAPTQRERILGLILQRGPTGLTDDEGEALLDIKPQSYTPRRNELVGLGLIADSGQRRPTESGRLAAVWIASEHAQAARSSGEAVNP